MKYELTSGIIFSSVCFLSCLKLLEVSLRLCNTTDRISVLGEAYFYYPVILIGETYLTGFFGVRFQCLGGKVRMFRQVLLLIIATIHFLTTWS